MKSNAYTVYFSYIEKYEDDMYEVLGLVEIILPIYLSVLPNSNVVKDFIETMVLRLNKIKYRTNSLIITDILPSSSMLLDM